MGGRVCALPSSAIVLSAHLTKGYTMDSLLEAKLAKLKNYATRYELAMIRGDDRILVCYTNRRGRAGIMDAVHSRATAMIWRTGTDRITFAKRAGDGATMGDWSIQFTGRTQRECYIEGALPYVENLPAAAPVAA